MLWKSLNIQIHLRSAPYQPVKCQIMMMMMMIIVTSSQQISKPTVEHDMGVLLYVPFCL